MPAPSRSVNARRRPVERESDLPKAYASGPIGDLLRYHNLAAPLPEVSRASLLIGMCMDNRKRLRLPDNFAFVIRTGGANLRYSEFKISFAVAIGGVRTVALIGHTQCGMVGLLAKRRQFVDGLVERAGWDREAADRHFIEHAPLFDIADETEFVLSEALRLRGRYPGIEVAPMIYRVEDGRLYLIEE